MGRKIKWGIAGLGNIARKFAGDLKLVPQAKLIGVASTNGDRAKAFQEEFDGQKAYDNYDDLYRDSEIEIIYIASLNQNHKAMTIAALNAGKGVLCEKPLGLNTEEIREMIALAQKQNCFLMEALWSRFNPAILKAKQWITGGQIGDPKFLYAEFSFYRLNLDSSHRLMDPKKGGGVLLDIGVYPLFLAYFIFGRPKNIVAQSIYAKTGVDVQTSMILQYENAQAQLYCGITNESDNNAKVGGTEGEILLHGFWHNAQKVKLVKAGTITQEDFPSEGNGYVPEIEEVNRCIASGKKESEFWSHKDAMELGRLVEQVFKKIREKN
ncbi:MAG: Gfo/Idh/MocA family oxidoreductase [Bacteroidota bacterium]|nr:Gfo/Idh/MocA family oxidoreductase [Bacteroidota bacterium]